MKVLVGANQEGIKRFSHELSQRLPGAFDQVISISKPVLSFLKGLDNAIGLVNLSMITLGAVGITKLVLGLESVIAALSGPVGLALLSLAGLAYVFNPNTKKDHADTRPFNSMSWKTGEIDIPEEATIKVPLSDTPPEKTKLAPQTARARREPSPPSDTSTIVIRFENSPAGMRVIQKDTTRHITIDHGLILGGAH